MQPPEGTVFRYAPTFKWRVLLCRKVLSAERWSDGLVDLEAYRSLRKRVCKTLDLSAGCLGLDELLMPIYNRELSLEERQEVIWRLAAGRERLASGLPVHPEFYEGKGEWVPLMIDRIRYHLPSSKGRMRLAVRFRLLDGLHAGLPFMQPISYDYVIKAFGPDLGLKRFQKHHYRELVGFRLAGFVSVKGQEPRMEYTHVPSSARTYNVKLRKERAEPCLLGFRWPCHECTIGYEYPDGCRLATHPCSYVEKFCPACDKAGWFDPSTEDTVCLVCRERATRKGERYVAGEKSRSGGAPLVQPGT
jgi:hypothetical protein